MKPVEAATATGTAQSSYECVHCCAPVSSLFLTYNDPSNTSLLQCPRCARFADPHLSFPFVINLLDVILLKSSVYRHFLRNRGGPTRQERLQHQLHETLGLGSVVLACDTLTRSFGAETSTDMDALALFAQTTFYCLIETASLLACIALAAALIVLPQRRWQDLRLIPLTFFYASIPVILFLVISSIIWRAEYLHVSPASANSANPPVPFLLSSLWARLDALYTAHTVAPASSQNGSDTFLRFVASFSRANLKSRLAEVASARGWASEALLRKWVGGTSAVVAFSVLFRTSKRKTAAVLLLAWLFHLIALHAIDPFLL